MLLIPSFLLLVFTPLEVRSELCEGRILLESPKPIQFSEVEKFFLCGGGDSSAWKEIPLRQARIHMKAFLQQRGYHLIDSSIQDGVLFFSSGPAIEVKSLKILGDFPERESLYAFRTPLLHLMTPSMLDSTKAWMLRQMGILGYACAEVNVYGNVEAREIEVHILPNQKRDIHSIHTTEVSGLRSGVLSRYYAFEEGFPFDPMLLDISSRRIESDAVVQNHNWNIECHNDRHVSLQENVIAGEPRLLGLGIGADTEEYIIGRLNWKSVRLDRNASSLELEASASFKVQRLTIAGNWYPFEKWKKTYFRPLIQIKRQSESRFETIDSDFQWLNISSWDFYSGNLRAELGPSFTDSRTFEGAGPRSSQFFSIMSNLSFMSREFEFFRASPEDGYFLRLENLSAFEDIYSDFDASMLTLNFEYLYNLMGLQPRILIFGFRTSFSSTWTNLAGAEKSELPSRFQHYLGGIQSLRGFDRQELPAGEEVALSKAFGGLELRSDYPFHPRFQPFVFFDWGFLGNSSFRLDRPFYFAPGGGIRWESPIGSIRGMIAHGFVNGVDAELESEISHFQWFISFGTEF